MARFTFLPEVWLFASHLTNPRLQYAYWHQKQKIRFILTIRALPGQELCPFHRKHHLTNASPEEQLLKTVSKVPLFSVERPHTVKGDRLRGIGCSPPYINPNRYTRYVLTDFRDLITVKITHKYALRGIVSITSLCARQTRALCIHTLLLIVPMPPTINRTNFSSLVSTALFPESNRSGALSLPVEPVERDIKPQRLDSNQ